jgi:APA family basic amino acid/polyamine antiporter
MSEKKSPASKNPASEHLLRGLGLLDATMIVVGSMIGSGIFLTSAASARFVGSPGWLLAAWAVAGILTITGALCCAELATMMPRAGGQYVFLREAYSPAVGFLFGWSLFLVIQTGTIAAVAIGFAKFMGVLAPQISSTNFIVSPVVYGRYALSLSTQQLVAILVILLLTITNTFGLRAGKAIQNTLTFTKTAALAGLIILGLTLGWRAGAQNGAAAFTSNWWNPWANGWSPQGALPDIGVVGPLALVMLLGRAMTGPLFAQSAWNNVTFTGSEVREPGRNLPRALLIGCGLVVALYILANLAYVVTLPLASIQKAPQDRVATATMQAILGNTGNIVMAVAIMVSTFGCNNGLILAGARVYYAMSRDRLFFTSIGRVNKFHVPATALIAQGVWASLLTLPRTMKATALPGEDPYGDVYLQLLDYIVSADLVFYILMVGAVFILRRKAPEAQRPYKTWGYPFVPALYILIALLLVLDLAYLTPLTAGIGYLLVFTGLPVYLIWRRSAAPRPAFEAG